MPSGNDKRIDGLSRLAELLESGHLSQEEFELLKAELLDGPATPPRGDRRHSHEDAEVPPPSERTVAAGETSGTGATSPIYKVAFGLGIASLFFGGTFGLLAWATVAVAAYALYSVKTTNRRWMAWTGLALGVVFSFMNAYLNGHLDGLGATEDISQPTAPTTSEGPNVKCCFEVLSIKREDFITSWNAAARPPDELVVMEETEDWFLASVGNDQMQLFHYGEPNVVSFHVSISKDDWDRLDQLAEYACVAMLDRDCSDELRASWDVIPPPTGPVVFREHTMAGMCWGVAKDAAMFDLRVDHESSC